MMEDLNLPYPNVTETDAKNHELDEEPVDSQEALKEDNKTSEGKDIELSTDRDSSKPPWLDTENSSKQNKQRRAPIWRESQHETLSSNHKRIKHEGKCERESVSSVEKVPLKEETLLEWLSKKDGVRYITRTSFINLVKNDI